MSKKKKEEEEEYELQEHRLYITIDQSQTSTTHAAGLWNLKYPCPPPELDP
jgi:hypothetical protein